MNLLLKYRIEMNKELYNELRENGLRVTFDDETGDIWIHIEDTGFADLRLPAQLEID